MFVFDNFTGSICIDKRLLVSRTIVFALTRISIYLKLYLTESLEADCRILLRWLRDPPLPPLTCNSWVPTAPERNARAHFVPDAVGQPEVAAHFAIPMPVLHVRSDVTDGQLKCYNLPPREVLSISGMRPCLLQRRPFFSPSLFPAQFNGPISELDLTRPSSVAIFFKAQASFWSLAT